MSKTINFYLVDIALGRADTTSFERFGQTFYGALRGIEFVPLGGHHDGGAEGFDDAGLFEDATGNFLQVSKEQSTRSKVRKTVKRLRKVGRVPRQLTYITSTTVPFIDNEEDKLSEELGLRVRIRDQKYIQTHINHSPATIEAFNSFLSPHLAFLKDIGGTTTISGSNELPARSLCVFLGQEVERRRGNTELLEAVTDSLILWALEGTDPEKKVFLSRAEILRKIVEALPSADKFIKGVLDLRLKALASKHNTNGREVRWHQNEDVFALPFETRKLVEQENTEDEILKASVSDVFAMRSAQVLKDDNEAPLIPKAVAVCHRSVEVTYEKQGLELSSFLQDQEGAEFQSTISDHVDQAMEDLGVIGEERGVVKDAVMHTLRSAFYKSEESERVYFNKLSRTYTLLFILKNEPRIVEFFRKMSGDLVLYVGTDLLVRALSEYYLPAADRMTWNMFKILKVAGARLILTEKTLEEVVTHVRAADFEFKNHYDEMERYVDLELARHIDRILIRAYFYAKIEGGPGRASGWGGFIGLFCTYGSLHLGQGQESLRKYLCAEYGLDYEANSETIRGIDDADLTSIATKILAARADRQKKREEELARNDALQVLRVYSKRRELKEGSASTPYGFRTWWLTQDKRVLRATGEIVAKHHAKYLMRPEFILNFIAVAPSADAVHRSYDAIFPSLPGVRLSNRLRPEVFEKVMKRVKDASVLGEARALALASELSDQLKGDHFREYELQYKGGPGAADE